MSIQKRFEPDEEERGRCPSSSASPEPISHVEEGERQSEVGHEEFVDSEPDDEAPFRIVGAVAARAAFRSIESVNLMEALQDRPSLMKSFPRFFARAVLDRHEIAHSKKMLASA